MIRDKPVGAGLSPMPRAVSSPAVSARLAAALNLTFMAGGGAPCPGES